MFTVRRAARYFAFVLTIAAAGCRSAPDILANLPEPQKQFCQILAKTGKGDLGSAIASLGPSAQFAAWHGQGSVHARNDGKTVAITFTPACPDPGTAIALEDDGSILANDTLGNSLQSSDFSQGMVVSGRFVKPVGSGAIAQFQLLSPVKFAQTNHAESPSVMASVFNAVTGQSQQARFCQILKNEPIERKRIEDEDSAFHQRFPLKATDLEGRKRELLSKMANDLYAVIGPSGKFTDWRGSMKVFSGVEETPESKRNHQPAKLGFAIAFTPDCFDQSDTVFSLQTDKGVYGSTNISSDSPLGKALQEMNPSQGKFTASGEFLWAPPPPKGGGMWVPPVDTRYHFYIVPNTAFYEGNYRFFVRFSQIS